MLTWFSVYLAITLLQLAIGDVIDGLPLPLRTLLLTAVVVPVVVYAALPSLMWLRGRVLARRHSDGD